MLRIKQSDNAARSTTATVPLKQISIDAYLRSFAANVTLTQVFENNESTIVEAVYW